MKSTRKILSVVLCLIFAFAAVAALASCGNKTEKVTVTFDPYYYMEDEDGFEVSNEDDLELEVEIEKGAKVGTLPKPTADGYKFIGWYAEDDEDFEEKYKKSTKVDENITLVAKWEKDSATDTGTNPVDTDPSDTGDGECKHNWLKWEYFDATCVDYGYQQRECSICGERQKKADETQPPLGHKWSPWEDIQMGRVKTCTVCSEKEQIAFKNITSKSILDVKLEGDWYAHNTASVLYNGNWDESHTDAISTKRTSSAVIVTTKSGVKADLFYIKGSGSTGYNVKVLYSGDSDYTDLGAGGIGGLGAFELDNTKEIKEIRIELPNGGSDGSDSWQEIAFAVRES